MDQKQIPRFDLDAVLSRRDALIEALTPFVRRHLVGEDYQQFLKAFSAALPRSLRRSTVAAAAASVRNAHLNANTLRDFCWRIAGNMDALRANKPVVPWVFQKTTEWMPTQIIRHELYRMRRGDIAHEFTFRVLAGSAAGLTCTRPWTRGQCSYLSRRVGFTRFAGKYPYRSPEQFVNLRLLAQFQSDPRFSENKLSFFHVFCSPKLVEWNRMILRARYKIDPPCPRNYTHDCHHCVIGYEECPAATHLKTFTSGECLTCSAPNAIFDPELSLTMCLECRKKTRLQRKDQKNGRRTTTTSQPK